MKDMLKSNKFFFTNFKPIGTDHLVILLKRTSISYRRYSPTMPRSLEYKAYNNSGTNRFGPYLRSLKKGIKFAWKHRNQIRQYAKGTANAIKSFRKNWNAPKRGGKAKVGGAKRLKSSLQGTSQHNDASSRFFKVTIRKGRRLKNKSIVKKKHHFKYGEEWNIINTSAEGVQNWVECKSIGSQQQLLGSPISASRSLFYSTAASYYELNPYRVNGGSSIFPAGTTGTPMANDKLYYRSVNGTLKIVNLTSLATYVQILWCKCKKSTGNSPGTTWQAATVAEQMGSSAPVSVTTTLVPVATAGFTNSFAIGNHPNMYQAFRDYWKIVHVEKTYLQGGDQVDWKFHFNINKLLNKPTYSQEPALFVANMSIVPLVIQYGALAAISDTASATTTSEVVHGITRLGIAITQNHEFGPVPAEMKTPTGQFFPGMVRGDGLGPTGHVIQERQIDDTDEVDGIERA